MSVVVGVASIKLEEFLDYGYEEKEDKSSIAERAEQ